MPPVCMYTPYVPILLYASVCSDRHLHVVGDCRGPFTCLTPPLHARHLRHMGDASPYVLQPHSLVGFPVHLYVWGISACCIGNIPLMLGFWGHSPICWRFWGLLHICQAFVPGSTSFGCPLCFILYLLCSSLCLMYLSWLLLLLLQLWWWVLVCYLFHQ